MKKTNYPPILVLRTRALRVLPSFLQQSIWKYQFGKRSELKGVLGHFGSGSDALARQALKTLSGRVLHHCARLITRARGARRVGRYLPYLGYPVFPASLQMRACKACCRERLASWITFCSRNSRFVKAKDVCKHSTCISCTRFWSNRICHSWSSGRCSAKYNIQMDLPMQTPPSPPPAREKPSMLTRSTRSICHCSMSFQFYPPHPSLSDKQFFTGNPNLVKRMNPWLLSIAPIHGTCSASLMAVTHVAMPGNQDRIFVMPHQPFPADTCDMQQLGRSDFAHFLHRDFSYHPFHQVLQRVVNADELASHMTCVLFKLWWDRRSIHCPIDS